MKSPIGFWVAPVDQDRNSELPSGVAVKVTSPCKRSEQSLPQSIPAPVTVPLPVPAFWTDSVPYCAAKVAVTVRFWYQRDWSLKTLHMYPETTSLQPDQP